ncbi:hypothetical protein BASA81_007064 [Batrachochytrium salamandrivorans]|nr:hypothetical protein BASA81_007064 [Batrachochytrium salamandrivorans]
MQDVSAFAEEDDGDLVFSDDVMDSDRIRRFLVAAGDADYIPLPIEDEGPYPDLEETDLTLLHWAAWYGQQSTILVLLEYGAKTTAKDVKGKTPLDLANQRGHGAEITALLSSLAKRRGSRVTV